MIALIKYYYKICIKQNKFIIPIICFCLFQNLHYYLGSEKFSPSIILCANAVFIIMIWIGFCYCEIQDLRTEQIAFLKTDTNIVFWISKIFFTWTIGIMISIIGTAWPIIFNSLKGSEVIPKSDIVLGFIIQLLISFMGALLGMILQPRVTGNRNNSILFICFIAILSMIKNPVIKNYNFVKVFAWILPPVNDLTSSCIGIEHFSFNMLLLPLVFSIIYILAQIFIYIKLMKKILF